MGSIPGLGKSPGVGHRNLLQYSCLENPMDADSIHGFEHLVCAMKIMDTSYLVEKIRRVIYVFMELIE